MNRVCAYLRCSTDKQDVSSQELEIQNYASRNNFHILKTFRDEGVSGKIFQRDGLCEMLKEIRQRRYDLILAYDLSRLGRNVRGCCEILEICQENKPDLTFIKDGVSTNSISGKLVFQIMASVAEMENSLRSARIKSGMDRARKENKKIGRPKILTAQLSNAIIELRQKNYGIRKIAKTVNCSVGVVYQALTLQ